MKTIQTSVAVAFMFVTGLAMGQVSETETRIVTTDSRDIMTFTLKAGLNYSNVFDSRTDDFSADGKYGFAGGAALSIPIGRFLGIQPEVLFSQKGFKGKGRLLGNTYTLTRTSNFIDVPLQVALKPTEFLTILAGPQYSYLISQKDVFSDNNLEYTQQEEFDNDNIRDNIFGFVVGLDVRVQHIVLGARFGWDIMNNHGDGTSSSPRYRNTWFQATLGYTF